MSRIAAAALCCVIAAGVSAGAGEGGKKPGWKYPEKAYTLRELLKRPVLIVIGTVRPLKGTKGDLLTEARIDVKEVLRGDAPKGVLKVVAKGPALPSGADAVWLLATKDAKGSWLVDHPQCAYGLNYVGRLRAALRRPRSIDVGEYLREDDKRLARRILERKQFALDRTGIASKTISGGLHLAASPSMHNFRAGESITVEFVLKNVGRKPLSVMNSTFSNFYLRARRVDRKGARPHLLNQKDASILGGMSLGLEGFVSLTDFVRLDPGEKFSRVLHFPPEHFKVLEGLGKVEIVGLFKVDLADVKTDPPPWKGVLVGEAATVEIVKP